MKRGIVKSLDKLIAAVLALLGCGVAFSGCEYGPLPCEYGSPQANYRVKGTITAPDGQPVKGIRVEGHYVLPDSIQEDVDAAYFAYTSSNDEGKYALRVDGWPMRLVVSDPDGAENGGAFAPDTIEVPVFTSADSIPDNNDDNWDWYGNFEKTVDIQLNPQSEEQPAETPQP